MVGSLSGAEGLGNAATAYFAQQAQGVSGLGPVGGLSGGEGVGGLSGGEGSGSSQSTASISGPGQLFANLQQLQQQNPTAFTQVVLEIASQLQAAAQQTQGRQSTFLSNLAAKFESIANGGSLSQLLPQNQGNQNQIQRAYSNGAQTQSQGVAGFSQQGGSQSSGNSSLQQLFATISNEVNQALTS
jgi:hypothetical protein